MRTLKTNNEDESHSIINGMISVKQSENKIVQIERTLNTATQKKDQTQNLTKIGATINN